MMLVVWFAAISQAWWDFIFVKNTDEEAIPA